MRTSIDDEGHANGEPATGIRASFSTQSTDSTSAMRRIEPSHGMTGSGPYPKSSLWLPESSSRPSETTSCAMRRHNACMPNIASILKAEISRVARKEVRAEIETLKKASVVHRASIAELRRQVNALEKELRRVTKGTTRSEAASVSDDETAAGTKRRFSATRLAAHRAKNGLSAANYGQLVGVSGQTIYHWEQGKARPRAAQLESLAAVRDLGAREIAERLASK